MLTYQNWVLGLSIVVRGTLEELITFCYQVYDVNEDRSLAREELFQCLKGCLIRSSGLEEDYEESIKEICEITMKKLDFDKDGKITFEDYKTVVMRDPLLLEVCGPCLPSPKSLKEFQENFMEKYAINYKKGNKGEKVSKGRHKNSNSNSANSNSKREEGSNCDNNSKRKKSKKINSCTPPPPPLSASSNVQTAPNAVSATVSPGEN